MKHVVLFSMISLGAAVASSANAKSNWSPTSSPLITRWAKDVTPDNVHPEYPRPQLVRKDWQSLNGLWDLGMEDRSTSGVGPMPRDFISTKVLVPFPIESALSGVGKHSHHVWYHRRFEVPADWRNRRIRLNFEAVDWEAHVYVNGTKVGEHQGAYDPFSFDITDVLTPDGPQHLVVGVWDPTDRGTQPRGKQVEEQKGIWYTPSTGIWQSVWMEPVAEGGVNEFRVKVDAEKNQVRITLYGDYKKFHPEVDYALLDGEKIVTSGPIPSRDVSIMSLVDITGKDLLATGDSDSSDSLNMLVQCRLSLPADLERWSPDNPKLYNLRLTLKRDGETIDEVETYFGLRTVEIRKVGEFQRIFLNGEEIFQVGTLDQGFWPDGLHTAPTDEALRWDIEETKKLGFNMIRKHIKVEPARWYYWCDKIGILVWQDMPSGNTNHDDNARAVYERELKRMIESRRWSPSIIMWVVFNEGWGQFDPAGTARMTDLVKRMDPTRLVNSASGWHDYGTGDIADIHMYPGPGAPRPEDERASVLGEFGGLGLPMPGHMWSETNWGYQGTSSIDTLTRRYEQLLRRVYMLKEEQGLCAAVYTQITDVETETNGMFTYDREKIKIIPEKIVKANRGQAGDVTMKKAVPTAQDGKIAWRYTTAERPGPNWMKPKFDDSDWEEGLAGFGQMEMGPLVRTDWQTTGIYLRREFDLPTTASIPHLYLLVWHDEDVQIYLNGEQAVRERGFRMGYEEMPISDAARATLKPGQNLIAIHCRNREGGQYIDAGLITVEEPE